MAVVDIIQLLKSEGGEKFYPVTHKNAVIGLNDFFEAVPDESGGISVKLKPEYTGLWTDGWIAEGGIGTRGVGGATYLSELQDVGISSPQPGHLLMYDPTQEKPWVNVPQSEITPDLSGYGHSLSLTNTATYLLDGNGNFLLDSNGNYLVTSVSSTSINLLNGSGTVISSVTLPTQSVSSLSVTVGSATIPLGGSATLTQIGVPAWAQDTNLAFESLPSTYIGRNAATKTAGDVTLLGIMGFTTDSSDSTPGDTSLVVWNSDAGAWHFKGNLYADGWIAAGGVGTGGGGGGGATWLSDLQDVEDGTPDNGDLLSYNSSSDEWEFVSRSSISPDLTDYATKNWVQNQGYLTAHQTVTLAKGTNNGTLKLTTAAGTTDNIEVKGLGSLAYKSSLAANDIPDISGTYATVSSVNDLSSRVTSLESLFEVVNGNVHVKSSKGLYSDSFLAAGGVGTGGGGGGYGVEEITTKEDGTVDFHFTGGDVTTVDLNHVHPQYPKYVFCADEEAYNAITTKESDTLYLIPLSSL